VVDGEGSVRLKLGPTEYKVAREKPGATIASLARAIAADPSSVAKASANGDVLELTAKLPGDIANDTRIESISGLKVTPFTGGRTQYIVFSVRWDGEKWIESIPDSGVRNTSGEAQAVLRNKFTGLQQTSWRQEQDASRPPRPPHRFRAVGGESGCADCGKEEAAHNKGTSVAA